MISFHDLNVAYPEQLWLEFSLKDKELAWNQCEQYSNPAARWLAFINRLCLNTLLPWLQKESGLQPLVWPSLEDLPSIWEVVNGTAIALGKTRIVLIPTEAIDTEEFCVQQEWVDILSFSANYYLAVQVHPEDCWVRVWGYATHSQLKNGRYDKSDRTYSIDREDAIEDLNVMWRARELCPDEKAEIHSLPTLSEELAEALLKQLGKPTLYSPRMNVPFEQWAAILSEPKYRHQLYNLRNKKVVKLSNWLQNKIVNTVQAGWQTIEALLAPEQQELALRYRGSSVTEDNSVRQAKLIDLGVQLGNKSLVMLVALTPDADDKVSIRVQVHPPEGEKHLPSYVRLALLESGEIRQEVQSRNLDNFIQLKRFKGIAGTSFSVQVALGDVSLTEEFEI